MHETERKVGETDPHKPVATGAPCSFVRCSTSCRGLLYCLKCLFGACHNKGRSTDLYISRCLASCAGAPRNMGRAIAIALVLTVAALATVSAQSPQLAKPFLATQYATVSPARPIPESTCSGTAIAYEAPVGGAVWHVWRRCICPGLGLVQR